MPEKRVCQGGKRPARRHGKSPLRRTNRHSGLFLSYQLILSAFAAVGSAKGKDEAERLAVSAEN